MELLTVTQLAEYLQCGMQTIYNLKHNKRIPYMKIGGLLRFSLEDINAWLKSKEAK